MKRKYSIALRIVFFILLIISVSLSLATFPSVSATTNDVRYKKKIVSVLFDNSFSMLNTGTQKENRTELAKYSLEMLTALLGDNDELYITPMNENAGFTNEPFAIDLNNRQAEIEEKIVNNQALYSNGSTPPESVARAISALTQRGLVSSENASFNDNQDIEYWLVMLTDGGFTRVPTKEVIEDNIKNYVGLNTIYLSFGVDAVDLTDPTLSLNKNYSFYAYCINNPQFLISAMQDIANKISGRYGADANSGQYTVNGKEIILNLDNFRFAVNSIAVIAQDCGAKLLSVTYKNQTIPVRQGNELIGSFINSEGANVQLFRNGYVAVVEADDYIQGNQVKFIFDKDVGNNISVLVEPAIRIDAYLERESESGWVKTDLQEINSTMSPGDEIRVQYKVYSSATDEELNVKEIFGTPQEKVTYCGKGYAISEPIPLERGTNSISVSVSLLNGSYTMYSNIICSIEENPTYYRLDGVLTEGTGADYKTATAIYTLYENNQPVHRNWLSEYIVETKIVYPDGSNRVLDHEMTDDFKLRVKFDDPNVDFGEYKFIATVTNQSSNLSRSNTQTFSILPREIKIACLSNDELSSTAYLLGKDRVKMEFAVSVDGQAVSFQDSMIDYALTFDGSDVTALCEVENGNLIFYVSADSVPNLNFGTKTVDLQVDVLGKVSNRESFKFEILSSEYRIELLEIGTRELDLYDLRNTDAAVYFQIYRDDILLSEEELNAALESGEIVVDTNPFGWITLLPCKVDVSVEKINDEAIVSCKVSDGMARPWDSLFSSFIFAHQKNISLSFQDVTESGTITIQTFSAWSRIWRWLVLLAIILLIVYIIVYIVGFFVAKLLPKGTFLRFSIDRSLGEYVGKPKRDPVNMKTREIVLWHLSRLIPWQLLKNQNSKVCLNNTVELRINKNRKTELVVKKKLAYCPRIPTENEASTLLDQLLNRCRYNQPIGALKTISKNDFQGLFERDIDRTLEVGSILNEIYGWYKVLRKEIENGRETDKEIALIIFVKYKKGKNQKRK